MGRTHTETERAELCEISEGETVSVRYSSNRSTSLVEREGVVESVRESSSGVITVRTEGFEVRFYPVTGSNVVESIPAGNRLDNGETVVVERVVEVLEDGDGISVEEATELLVDEDDDEEESSVHAARIEAQLRMAEEDDVDDEDDPAAEVEDDEEREPLPDFEEYLTDGGDDDPELVTDGGEDRVEYDAVEHFAAYIGGLVELDTSATEDGSAAVVRASVSALRDAQRKIEARGYETTLVDVDPEASGLIVSPSDRDLREVLDSIEEGIPEPGEGLVVDDPIDRDGEPVPDGGIIVAGDGGEVLDDEDDQKAQGRRESRSGMSDYRERVTAREADVIDGLVSGSLTEKQAVAYVLREVSGRTREETAEIMGMSTSSVDTHRARGAAKVEEARSTVDALDDDPELVTDGGREEPRRPPVAEGRSDLVDSLADRIYDSIEFGDVDREEALGAVREVYKEVESGTPSLKRFEDLEAGEDL